MRNFLGHPGHRLYLRKTMIVRHHSLDQQSSSSSHLCPRRLLDFRVLVRRRSTLDRFGETRTALRPNVVPRLRSLPPQWCFCQADTKRDLCRQVYWIHDCGGYIAKSAEVASRLYECIRSDCCGVSQNDAAVLYITISYTYMHILQDPMHICIIILQYPIYVYIVQI